MFTGLLILVGLVAVLLVVIISLQPAEFSIKRSATILAPPSAVFSLVNDFHNWPAWSPWAKIDPDMKQIYDGPPAGAGASNTWIGNKKVGEGTMTILQSQPGESVLIKLEFRKPFKATNMVEFTFKENDGPTVVTWRMSGHHNFMMKGFHLLLNMEKMLGDQFEKGLAQMKTAAEAASRK
jgi:uncharacterized protein YndB with AHSA1/START domain